MGESSTEDHSAHQRLQSTDSRQRRRFSSGARVWELARPHTRPNSKKPGVWSHLAVGELRPQMPSDGAAARLLVQTP